MKKYYKNLSYILCMFILFCCFFQANPIKAYATDQIESPSFDVASGFDQSYYCISYGERVQLNKVGSGKVIYHITDTRIANIKADGTITGLRQGRTYLTATVGKKTYQCKIAVIVPRLSTRETVLTINHENSIVVTLRNRKESEKIKLEVDDNNILEAMVDQYSGDQATVTLVPKQNGTITLTISRSNSLEQLRLCITVKKAAELSAIEVYKKCSGGMVEITSTNAAGEISFGSGFFISNHQVMTNYHVIKDAVEIKVVDYAGKQLIVDTLYDYKEDYDLALLGIQESHKFLAVSYESNRVGERIYTIGSPYGLTGTFSSGIIAMTSRKVEEDDVLYTQITAPISHGNSGGPLINSKGEVIGVNTCTRPEGQNLNFAVPSTYFMGLDQNNPSDIQTFYKK